MEVECAGIPPWFLTWLVEEADLEGKGPGNRPHEELIHCHALAVAQCWPYKMEGNICEPNEQKNE